MKKYTNFSTDAKMYVFNLLAFYFFITVGLDPLTSTFLAVMLVPFVSLFDKERRELLKAASTDIGKQFNISGTVRKYTATVITVVLQTIVVTALISLVAQVIYHFSGLMNVSYILSIAVFGLVGMLINFHISIEVDKINNVDPIAH